MPLADDTAKTSFEKTLLQVAAILASLGGVITATSTFSEQLAKATGILGALSIWQAVILSAALFLVAVWTFAQSRRRRSILAKPDALRLDRGNPAHLKGRDEDLERLVPLVMSERLLFVEGESGAGKSALLQAGLLPKLRTIPSILPILVESLSGDDWEHEPRRFVALALTAAMAGALTPEQRQKLFVGDVVAPETVLERLGQMFATLGRMPVLLLDQFDDYQNRFLDRFLIQKSWLKPDDLIAANGFWAELKSLLDAGRLNCLVVTRTDTAGGLASIQFRAATTYRIDRMKVQFVAELVDTLVGPADAKVVTDPDRGWTDLVKRLAADLERGDAVLPQQLRIVLLGLGTIPRRIMTVGALDRAGGVSGLEAGFIEGCVARVARLATLEPGQLRALLLALVDPHTGVKTIELTAGQIAHAIPNITPTKLSVALDEFERLEVVRRRGDAEAQAPRWLLDHDYLARAVREADRRANRWTRALAEGADRLHRAGASWSARWRSLLPPSTQLALLADRLRGRFHYGPHRPYALLSTTRLTPYALLVLALIGLGANEYRRSEERRREQAIAQQLNRLAFETTGSPYGLGGGLYGYKFGLVPQTIFKMDQEDGAALVALARMDDRSRLDAFRLELTDFSRRRKLLRQPTALLTALFGTSPSQRAAGVTIVRALANDMLVSGGYDGDTVKAIAVSSNFLKCPAQIPISWWLAAIEANKDDVVVLGSIASAFAPLSAAYTTEQARESIPALLAAIAANRTTPFAQATLIRGAARLGGYLSLDQARAVTAALLQLVPGASTVFADAEWAADLGPLVDKMTAAQLKTILSVFSANAAKNTSFFGWFNVFVSDWSPAFDRMSLAQGSAVAPIFLSTVDADGTSASDLNRWAGNLLTLKPKMTADQASTVTSTLLAALKSNTSLSSFELIMTGLAPWTDTMTREQTETMVAATLAAAKANQESPDLLAMMNRVWVAWADKMSTAQKQVIASILLKAMTRIDLDSEDMDRLMEGVKPFLKGASREQAYPAIAAILGRIETHKASCSALGRWTNYLAAFDDKLIAAEWEGVIALCMNAATGTTGVEVPSAANALRPFAGRMTADQRDLVVKALLAWMNESKDAPLMLAGAAARLEDWIDYTTIAQARAVIATGEDAFEASADPDAVGTLERLLALASRRLPRDEQLSLGLRMLQHPAIPIYERNALIQSLSALTLGPSASGDNLWAVIAWAQAEAAAGRLTGYPPPTLFH